ncbi:hypothetical protein Tco_1280498 [Tanacetum coccineum]
MGQMAEAFQERPLCVLPSNTKTNPLTELNVITSMDGLTLDGSFIPHSNFLVYQEEEQEPETITEVVEISSSQSTPLVPPPIDIVDSLGDKFPIENNSLSGNPTPSSDSVVESLSPLLTPFEDTFCFDVDHIEEKSSGSTTSHFDLSLLEYESFDFDFLINQLPPADRSDFYHKEFAYELAHTISPPEYDHFYFDLEDDPGELTILLKKNISETLTKDLKINELNDFPFFLSDCDSIFSEKFSEIDLLVLFPSRDKDKVFDPGIFTINGVHSKRFSILLLDDFSSILFVSDSLLLIDPSEIDTFLSFSSRNEDKVFDPGILLNNGIFSFTRKSSHLLIDNFMIDNYHILSEISLKIVSSINFHPKDKKIRRESS